MNCPVCGKEMRPGTLNTYGMWNYFLPQGAEAEMAHGWEY